MSKIPNAFVAGTVTVQCPAKLNLFLEVSDKRSDGYHEIETVMTCVSLADRLSFAVADASPICLVHEGVLELDSNLLPPPQENLVTKALLKFQQEASVSAGAQVLLSKSIPTQAGLGGASSDAAAALLLANRMWQINWPLPRLSEFAATIGSDVPFFLRGGFAICSGRGEKITPCPGIGRVPVVIVRPPIGFATRDVYREHLPPKDPRSSRAMVAALHAGNLRQVARLMFNRLQSAAEKLSDWPERLGRCFSRLPTIGHQMTGSGSCYFGLFGSHRAAGQAAARISAEFSQCRIIKCELIATPHF
jgi:4-diphosphocytidyl-2-C-methyl-D-erythritol kinase